MQFIFTFAVAVWPKTVSEAVLPKSRGSLETTHAPLTVSNTFIVEGTDAAVALPGGSGTLEELLETVTWKRLGLYLAPIVLVNTQGYFDNVVSVLERCIKDRFMDERHRDMWSLVQGPEDVIPAIENAPGWGPDAKHFAAL